MKTENIVIFGSNISSHAAAIYAAMSNRDPLLMAVARETGRDVSGVDKYPGIPGASYEELYNKMTKQVNKFSVRCMKQEGIPEVNVEDGWFVVNVEDGQIRTRSLIISTEEMKEKIRAPQPIEPIEGGSKTTVEGLFVCGTAATPSREAVVLSGLGSMAAMDARWYLDKFSE